MRIDHRSRDNTLFSYTYTYSICDSIARLQYSIETISIHHQMFNCLRHGYCYFISFDFE